MQYASLVEEMPFIRAVQRFPITRDCKLAPNFLRIGEASPGAHIPSWLPAFPDSHTYMSTPVWNERATDPWTDKIEQSRQRRKAERSLVNLRQRLMCNRKTTTAFNLVDGDFGVRGKHKEEKRIENKAFSLVDGDFGIRGKLKDVKQIENPFLHHFFHLERRRYLMLFFSPDFLTIVMLMANLVFPQWLKHSVQLLKQRKMDVGCQVVMVVQQMNKFFPVIDQL